MVASLPCVICAKALDDAFSGQDHNQPSEGLVFTSHGNYGSTIFDPMSKEYLEINICDECIEVAAAAGRVLRAVPTTPPPPEVEYETWRPRRN